MIRRILPLLALAVLVAACGDDPFTAGDGMVTFNARVSQDVAAAPGVASDMASPGAHFDIQVDGTNGTLVIDRTVLVVSEFELEGAPDACEEAGGDDDDDCEEFEADPFVLDLALDGSEVRILTGGVTPGVYTEMELEVEDMEVDDDDDDEGEATAIMDQLTTLDHEGTPLADFWPEAASMMVTGTFTPADPAQDPRPFLIFVDAEVEVELTFAEPIVVDEAELVDVTLVLDPGAWFVRPDGTVRDLSQWSWNGPDDDLLELEVELEDGFVDVEVDDD